MIGILLPSGCHYLKRTENAFTNFDELPINHKIVYVIQIFFITSF